MNGEERVRSVDEEVPYEEQLCTFVDDRRGERVADAEVEVAGADDLASGRKRCSAPVAVAGQKLLTVRVEIDDARVACRARGETADFNRRRKRKRGKDCVRHAGRLSQPQQASAAATTG